MKLQTKLLLGLLPPALLAIVFMGVWSMHNATKAQLEIWGAQAESILLSQAKHHLEERAEQPSDPDSLLPNELHDLKMLAAFHFVEGTDVPWQDQLFILNGSGMIVRAGQKNELPGGLGPWSGLVERMQHEDLDVLHGSVSIDQEAKYYCAVRFRPWDWFEFVILDDSFILATEGPILRTTALAVSVVGVATVLIVTILLRTFFIRPVDRLRLVTRDIASNRKPTTTQFDADDELGELGRDILKMGRVIQENRARMIRWNELLEEQVRRRTGALSSVNQRLSESLSRSEKAEKALRIYENIISKSKDLILLVDGEGCVQLANEAFATAADVPIGDVCGLRLSELVDPEYYELHVKPNLDRAMSGESFRYNVWINPPGMGRRYASIAHIPIPDHAERIVGVALSIQDITDLKETELALQRYAERLSLAAGAGELGVWEWLLARDRVIWDERMYAMHGVDRVNFVPSKSSWMALVHEEDRGGLEREFKESVEGRKEFSVQYRVRSECGDFRHIQAVARIHEDETGQINRMVGINRDITEQKLMEELREDIERITRHDLKSPLATAIGVSALIAQDENINDDQRRLLKMVEQAGRRMLDAINVSLDLYKIETGQLKPKLRAMNLEGLIREVAEFIPCGTEAGEETIVFDTEGNCDGKCPSGVLGEVRLLSVAFDNILRNAVEASPPGGKVEVRIRCSQGCTVTVRNQGEVPESIRTCFFEKYVTEGKRKGTGLGTYSARLLVESQGGKISMRTGDGMTEVEVFLPPGESARS